MVIGWIHPCVWFNRLDWIGSEIYIFEMVGLSRLEGIWIACIGSGQEKCSQSGLDWVSKVMRWIDRVVKYGCT